MRMFSSKSVRFLVAATMLALCASALRAEEAQFYFVARSAPEGSITAGGQARQVVYLRWDALEGRLPDDVAFIRLLRDGEELLDQPVAAVMPPAEIAALYQGPAQARRLQETLTALREVAAAEGNSFAAGAFAVALHAKLDSASPAYKRVWAALASNVDFNIARARYRGFVDEPGAGVFRYELQARTLGGLTQLLGRVDVDTRVPTTLLGASGLQQVRGDVFSCDLPEAAKDHYTVALTWAAPGASVVDRAGAQVYLAGFDLYRTRDNIAPGATVADVTRDLAAAAATVEFDERGRPLIPGLVKVNDTLVNDPGGSPTAPKWLETSARLGRDGLRPGDRRAYYLVARDFTGNYGPTTTAIIEVPNLTRPPAPWQVRPFVDQTGTVLRAGENLSLRWDAVNLDNYLAAFGSSRRACNLFEARNSGVLEFVGADQDCDRDTRRSVRLDVESYVVYRFADFDAAQGFADSDGDGVADQVERPAGMQCDVTQQPSGATSDHALGGQFVRYALPDSGREVVRFIDPVPAGEKGQVYWYRIASFTADGRLSRLSYPVRGLFPDRELPPPPTVEVSRPARVPSGCQAEVRRTTGPWNFTIDFVDNGQPFGLSCGASRFNVDEKSLPGLCKAVSEDCAGLDIAISYPPVADTGGEVCEATVPAAVPFCSTGEVALRPAYAPGEAPASVGQVVEGPLSIEVLAPNAETCVSLFQDIDGEQVRVGTSCGEADTGRVLHAVPAGFFCGYAVAHDANNNVSESATVPCVMVLGEARPPGMPQLLDFSVGEASAQLRWRAPVEPLAAVLARIEHEKADGTRSSRVLSFPVAGVGSGEPVNQAMEIEALVGETDRWCVSLRSVGINAVDLAGRVSDWTPRRCVSRSDTPEVAPVYLPWPSVAGPVQQQPLPGGLFNLRQLIEYTVPALLEPSPIDPRGILWIYRIAGGTYSYRVNEVDPPVELVFPGSPAAQAIDASADTDAADFQSQRGLLFAQPLPAIELGRVTGLTRGCSYNSEQLLGYPPHPALECDIGGLARAQAAFAQASGFLVYRQSRAAEGGESDWQQVSPLIEYAHWDALEVDPLNKEAPTARLNDPYVKMLRAEGDPDTWRFMFFDRYPQVFPLFGDRAEYRYQLVYFDERHRPVAWRRSDWLTLPGEGG
jgi:hypothetical protein